MPVNPYESPPVMAELVDEPASKMANKKPFPVFLLILTILLVPVAICVTKHDPIVFGTRFLHVLSYGAAVIVSASFLIKWIQWAQD